MKLMFFRRSVLGAVLLLAGASLAAADTIEYSVDIFLPPGNEGSLDQFPVTRALEKFNTSFGTLQSVQLRIDYTFTGEITVINFTQSSQPITGATSSVPLTVTAQVGLPVDENLTVGVTAVTAVGPSSTTTPDSSFEFPGPEQTPGTFGQNVPKGQAPSKLCPIGCNPGYVTYKGLETAGTGSSGAPSSLASVLLAFSALGGGTFDVQLKAEDLKGNPATYTGGAAPGVFFGGSANVGGTVTVIYTYFQSTEIPEPMTMMLVGTAVLALGLFMRQRGRAKA